MSRATCAAFLLALLLAAPAGAASLPADTIGAREHFFGAEHVDAKGGLPENRVLLSWFSVASMAMAIDGRVVLLDTYVHKGEDEPNYVPTTTEELIALRPEAIFIGHGHFDHANTAGLIAGRTGALIVGTPEHCDQARAQAPEAMINCVDAVPRGAEPGALGEFAPLGEDVRVTALKHVHSAAQPPDGELHETSLTNGFLPDVNQILLHPPGAGTVAGLASGGDENGTVLYQFRIGDFSLVWHDSVGPLREAAPQILDQLETLRPTDVEIGSTLGFNDPTNGQRDAVDYMVRLKPDIFFPIHHDFIAEYGVSKGLEGVFRREYARRESVGTDIRWLYDPFDYLRPGLMTFDVDRDVVRRPRCLPVRPRLRSRLGRTLRGLSRKVAPRAKRGRVARWCVTGRPRARVIVKFGRDGRSRLVILKVRGQRRAVARAR